MTQLKNIPLENAYETNISGSITAATVSVTVDTAVNFTLPAGQTVDAVIDPENSKRERVKITAISGSVLTVTRGQPDYLGDTSAAVSHSGGATFVITDSWSIFNDIATAVNSKIDTVDGALTSYANATARDAAITSPANGMQCYLADTGKFYDYTAGSWIEREAGGTFPNASTTVAGKVEIATEAQVKAGTGTGETGAELVIAPDNAAISPTTAGAADAGGLISRDAAGLIGAENIELGTNGGLEDSSGLKVKVKVGGGVTLDSDGLSSSTSDIFTTDYTYGETIAIKDCLYHKRSDNKVYKVTSDPATWNAIIGIAKESGNAGDTGKLIQLQGLITGASFSAINPTFSNATADGGQTIGGSNVFAAGFRVDNTAGAETLIDNILVSLKKTGNPAWSAVVDLVLGDSVRPAWSGDKLNTTQVGASLGTASVAESSVSGVYEDYTFDFSDVQIPANSYVWIVIWTLVEDPANYYTIETNSTGGVGAFNNEDTNNTSYNSNTRQVVYTMNTTSVNPWDKRYGVRAYNGTNGGIGIGEDAGTSAWGRVIGHVVTATTWYLNLTKEDYRETFTASQTVDSEWWNNISLASCNFRPSSIDATVALVGRTMTDWNTHDADPWAMQLSGSTTVLSSNAQMQAVAFEDGYAVYVRPNTTAADNWSASTTNGAAILIN